MGEFHKHNAEQKKMASFSKIDYLHKTLKYEKPYTIFLLHIYHCILCITVFIKKK